MHESECDSQSDGPKTCEHSELPNGPNMKDQKGNHALSKDPRQTEMENHQMHPMPIDQSEQPGVKNDEPGAMIEVSPNLSTKSMPTDFQNEFADSCEVNKKFFELLPLI